MNKFEEVTQRHNNVIIVGCGESLRGFDFQALNHLRSSVTIAVNWSYWYFQPNYWITADPNGDILRIIADQTPRCYRFVGCDKPLDFEGIHYLRRAYVPYDQKTLPVSPRDRLLEEKDQVQVHNSAFSAANLAYHFEAKKILLLGIDADWGGHFYDNVTSAPDKDPRGWAISFSKIPKLFEGAISQFDARGTTVVNGSLRSWITCFDKLPIAEGLAWIDS